MAKKVRIVERKYPDGRISYVIQQKHMLFRWWWVDAWMNCDVNCIDSFSSLAEAKKNLCYFDGSRASEKVVFDTGA